MPEGNADQNQPPLAPPTESGADILDVNEPPSWPKVVGGTSIGWGGLLLTCAGCGVAGIVFLPQLMGGMANQPGGLPPTMQPTITSYVSLGLSVVWAVFLVVCGILTVLRVPAARWMSIVYAIGGMALAIWGTVIQLDLQTRMALWCREHPDSPFAQGQGGIFQWIVLGIVFFLGYSWPVFCLIWFGFVKRTPESMTAGTSPPAA